MESQNDKQSSGFGAFLGMIVLIAICVGIYYAYTYRSKSDGRTNRPVPTLTTESEHGSTTDRSSSHKASTNKSETLDRQSYDSEKQAKDLCKEVIPVDDEAFEAAEDFMKAKPGSKEERNAQGRLLRESTEATGRMLREGFKDATKEIRSKDFWRGIRDKKKK